MVLPISSAGYSALSALRSINSGIDEATTRVSTGNRINSAADGAAYWEVATKLESQIGALTEVKGSIALGGAAVSTALAGAEGIVDDLNAVRDLLVSATVSGADRANIQTQIDDYLSDMSAKANAAQANDTNLISVDSSAAGYNATASIVANFTSDGSTITVTTIDVNRANTAFIDPAGGTAAGILDQDRTVGGTTDNVLAIDISALTDSTADQTTLTETIGILDAALDDALAATSTLGTTSARIESAESYLQTLIDAKSAAVTDLISADLDAEATRLTALQTQQQLAIEALSISNSQFSSILSLFR